MSTENALVKLVFETHATSLDNEDGLASGWHDVDLSPAGERQARELGERRSAAALAAVYCSDLRRSYDTAAIAFAAADIPIVRDARLRECDYGLLTGHPAVEIEARRAAAIQTPFPDGESYQQVVERVASWLAEVRLRYEKQTILVIGHRATFYALEHLLNAAPLEVAVARRWQWQPGWEYATGDR